MANYDLELIEAKRVTLNELEIYGKAYALKQVDVISKMHQQAWLNEQIGSTDKKGKPVYRKFNNFFNYDDAYMKALRPEYKPKKKMTLEEKNMKLQEFIMKGGK